MIAITLMRFIYANEDYENKTKLLFYLTLDMKFFIKERLACLAIYRKEGQKDEHNRKKFIELSNYAEQVLYSLHKDSSEANQYVREMIRELSHH